MEMAGMVVIALCALFVAQPPFAGADTALDFCVADLHAECSPSGFACKGVSSITADDFAYSGLSGVGNTSNIMSSAVTTAFATDFPGINGLGLSMARVDFAPGGFVPMHSHPRASEVVVVIQGRVLAGFISADNVPYSKQLEKGDIFAYPKGVLHFLMNSGKGNALVFAIYASATPGLQFTYEALFGNNLPAAIVSKSTFISEAVVNQLKAQFGGQMSPLIRGGAME